MDLRLIYWRKFTCTAQTNPESFDCGGSESETESRTRSFPASRRSQPNLIPIRAANAAILLPGALIVGIAQHAPCPGKVCHKTPHPNLNDERVRMFPIDEDHVWT
ncbi:hypothetical protein BDN72DRAFT_835571 [Pluteus cervinus]|uniref:Uncharacterized protein n=1 Tax=Pluteus cervinus TaxID=181527 RepID=A0ACD3B539_9AGAR|nr:hypothetical protein BDN72DRAFT_835571 [Pluteus cervinus]